MYLFRDNRLILIDIHEDNHRLIRAVKTVDIPSTVIITKQTNDMVTYIDVQYQLIHEFDGYIFKKGASSIGGHHLTIGDAIKTALRLRFRVYNDEFEIIDSD